MIYDILYESCPWHTRAALFDGSGNLLALHYEDESLNFIEGAVIWGKIRKISSALNAAFVDIGDTVDGFLPLDTLPQDQQKPHEGQSIVVRIVSGKTAGKGAKLDARVLHETPPYSTKAPAILEKPPSALSRALMEAGLTPVRVWIIDHRSKAEIEEMVPEDKIFILEEHAGVDFLDSLDTQLEGLAGPVFSIPGGGRLTVEITKAVTAIDVDTADVTSMSQKNKMHLTMETNLRAADEIARLCHLLQIGGSIIIDFISMPGRGDKKQLQEHLEKAFAERDSQKVDILKISRYGIAEINRKKVGESLISFLKMPTNIAGEILLKLWRHKPGKTSKFVIEAPLEVADILKKRLSTDASLAYLGCPVEIMDAPQETQGQHYRLLSAPVSS